MVGFSKIEWTDSTWNPVTGCSKVSPGCQHCYAERMARRLCAMGQKRYRDGFKVTLHPDLVRLPLSWRDPRMVFVNSMSDLFHELVPTEYIRDLFAVMNAATSHTFQILTKRSERLKDLASTLRWTPNIWMGVTVENSDYLSRINDLLTVPASVRFLSIEPLLGPVEDVPTSGINWVIVGGESGPGARPVRIEWVRHIRDKCLRESIPFFFKQWGGVNKKARGYRIDGRTWRQMPDPWQPRRHLG